MGRKSGFLLIGAIPVLCLAALAQPGGAGKSPVTLGTVDLPAEVAADRPFQATVKLAIAAPYHIYAFEKNGPVHPTDFRVGKASEGQVALAGAVSADRKPKHFDDGYSAYDYWEGTVVFTVPLVVKDVRPGEEIPVALVVDYMACTEEFCLPPAKLAIDRKVKVAGVAAPSAPPDAPAADGRPKGEPAEDRPPQEPAPSDDAKLRLVSAKVEPAVAEGGQFAAVVTVEIESGWHVYGLHKRGLEEPTTFEVAKGSDRVAIAGGPKADRAPLEHRGAEDYENYDYWEDKVTFTVPLALHGAREGEEVPFVLSLGYMTCDANGCLPPANLPMPLRVTAGAGTPAVAGPAANAGGSAQRRSPSAGGAGRGPVEGTFDRATLEPGQPAVLFVPLPLRAANAGLRLGDDRVTFTSPGIRLAAVGEVEEFAGGVRLRLPVEMAREGLADGPYVASGRVSLPEGKVEFSARGEVHQPLLAFLLFAAGAALLALLTPCVFPMVPITISFFTKQAEKAHHAPATLGLIYCTGIVLSFVALGLVFTLALGATGAATFATHWATQLFIALLFIVFALSLFGAYEMQLPASMMNLVGRAQGQGGTLGVWMLGLLFSVTTFTCTAPFVGGLLFGAAATGQWTRPVLGMLVFSGVLAIPFFFLSVFPSRLKSLPKSGGWLNEVKVCMGFVELAAAFKFLGGMDMVLHLGVFSRTFVLCSWIAIFGDMGLYLLGGFRLPHDTPRQKTGVTTLLFALFCLGFAVYLGRGLSGEPLQKDIEPYLPMEEPGRTPAGRLAAIAGQLRGAGGGAAEKAPEFKNDYARARSEASRLGRPLFINFTGYT